MLCIRVRSISTLIIEVDHSVRLLRTISAKVAARREYWCGGAENRRDMCPRVQIGCCTWRYAFVSKRALGKFALPPVVCELYRVAEQTECGHGDLLVVVQIERPQQARTASTIYVDVSGPSLEAERHIEVSPRSRIFGLTRTLCAHAEIVKVRI